MEHAPCLELVVYDQVRPEFATITKIVAGFTIFKMGLDLTDLAKFSRSGLSMLPIEICLGGRKMRAVQSIMDALTRGGENIGSVDTPFGTLRLMRPTHPNAFSPTASTIFWSTTEIVHSASALLPLTGLARRLST